MNGPQLFTYNVNNLEQSKKVYFEKKTIQIVELLRVSQNIFSKIPPGENFESLNLFITEKTRVFS